MKLSMQFLRALKGEPALFKYWTSQAIQIYRRTVLSEPFPGLWPKYVARIDLAMAFHQEFEGKSKRLPKAFRSDEAEQEIDCIDFYAVSEHFVTNALAIELGETYGTSRGASAGRRHRQ